MTDLLFFCLLFTERANRWFGNSGSQSDRGLHAARPDLHHLKRYFRRDRSKNERHELCPKPIQIGIPKRKWCRLSFRSNGVIAGSLPAGVTGDAEQVVLGFKLPSLGAVEMNSQNFRTEVLAGKGGIIYGWLNVMRKTWYARVPLTVRNDDVAVLRCAQIQARKCLVH